MNKLFISTLLFLAFHLHQGFSQSLKPNYPKNTIQIGKTGYYFDKENPFGFGIRYFPHIGYTRNITPKIGLKASIDSYLDCYACDKTPRWPRPVFEVQTRTFTILQFNFLYELSISERLSFIPTIGLGYRWGYPGELWIKRYVFHPLWLEAFGGGKSFHEWGAGGAFEVKYKFYKQFSLSAKGEYFRFPVRPKQHWGAGVYLGYDF
jgi:hypothetical protein